MRLPRGLAPLAIHDFALYLPGFFITRVGRKIEETGAVWLMWELTESPVALGLMGLFRAIPAIGLSPIAGVVADRVDQKRLLYWTQAMGLVLSFGLGLLVVTGMVEVWHIYVQVTAQQAVDTFDGAARQAYYPRLVPNRQLAEAVTLNSSAGRLSHLVGPLIGGVAIATLGESAPFFLNAATFPGLMLALALMHYRSTQRPFTETSFRGELVEGFRYILRDSILSGIMKLEIVVSTFQINAAIITIVGREVLEVGPIELGVLLGCPAIGSFTGIVGLIALGPVQKQGRFILAWTVVYGIAMAAFGLATTFGVAAVVLAFVGLGDALITTTRHSVMQLASPAELRGRVVGNMATVTRGLTPFAETQSGLLSSLLGPQLAVMTAAAALGLAGVVTARTNPALRSFVLETRSPR